MLNHPMVFWWGVMAIFFWPALVAFWRRHPQAGWILGLLVVTGGTGVGWLAALWRAAQDIPPKASAEQEAS